MKLQRNIFSSKQELFLDYLIERSQSDNNSSLSIEQVSGELSISTARVRELLELAKAIGLVDIQPRKGIQILPYKFSPAVRKSLYAAVRYKQEYFEQFSHLRNQIEKSYFLDAVLQLSADQKRDVTDISQRALDMLNKSKPRIPHEEHRRFHMTIYKELDNVFVIGILEAFWDLYEVVGLNLYEDLDYLINVWNYHQEIAEKINSANYKKAHAVLVEHMELIHKRT